MQRAISDNRRAMTMMGAWQAPDEATARARAFGLAHDTGLLRAGRIAALQRTLNPPYVGSIPTRPTHGSSNALRRRRRFANQVPIVGTAKQVKCCGDTLVSHTRVGGFNSPHLLDAGLA